MPSRSRAWPGPERDPVQAEDEQFEFIGTLDDLAEVEQPASARPRRRCRQPALWAASTVSGPMAGRSTRNSCPGLAHFDQNAAGTARDPSMHAQ